VEEITIDDSNFSQYFKDAKNNPPQHGEVLAVYKAVAELSHGDLKTQIVDTLIFEKIGAQKAIQLLVKFGHTSYRESLKVIKNICSDLLAGMKKEMVISKSYEYVLEMQFYTKPEFVPLDNKHWEIIGLKNFAINK
jgi:hypothetical protein